MHGKRRKISGQVKFEAGMEVLRGEKSVAHIYLSGPLKIGTENAMCGQSEETGERRISGCFSRTDVSEQSLPEGEVRMEPWINPSVEENTENSSSGLLDATCARRTFLKRALGGVAGTIAASGAGWGYARLIEPRWLELAHVSLPLPRLSPTFHGYRLVQLSDLHLGDWLQTAQLHDLILFINQQQPDLIAITGDFITDDPALVADDLLTLLKLLKARDGVIAVLGNHDHCTDPALIRQVLQRSGIVELRNKSMTIERRGEFLCLAGVDDISVHADDLEHVLKRLPGSGAAILLAHEPDFADVSAASGRFDLQLSGHSHGGQVVLPFLGPLRLPPYGRKYPRGRYQVGSMLLYTNRGVGMVAPHYRFNCRPEITLFSLEASQA